MTPPPSVYLVSLPKAMASLVLISQLLFWGRSEPPNVNSPACAELHAARAAVYRPNINHFQPRPGTPIPEGWFQKWEEAALDTALEQYTYAYQFLLDWCKENLSTLEKQGQSNGRYRETLIRRLFPMGNSCTLPTAATTASPASG